MYTILELFSDCDFGVGFCLALKGVNRRKMPKLSKAFKEDVKPKQSAYMIFKAEKMVEMKLKKLSKEQTNALKKEWSSLDKDELEGFKQKALADGVRFKRAKAEFLSKHDTMFEKKSGSAGEGGATNAKVGISKPRKWRTAKHFFQSSVRSKVKAEHPDFTKSQITDEIGRRWEALDPVNRMVYVNKESSAKADYDSKLQAYLAAHGKQGAPPVSKQVRKAIVELDSKDKKEKRVKVQQANDENSNSANKMPTAKADPVRQSV